MTNWSLTGRLVLPDGSDGLGAIEIEDGRIGRVIRSVHSDADAWTIVPGFVDIHVHGGGGHTVTTGEAEGVLGSVDFHRRHGTTTTLVSLVTAALDELADATARIAGLLDGVDPATRAQIAGVHLEGPFLATARCGAQNPAHMVDPTPDAVDLLIASGRGALKVVTIAPERPGAIDAIRRLVAAGVVAAIGHTDADYDQASAAIDAGVRLATHLGNAMPPMHHRAPGPIGRCLADPAVVCELIVDGHHLHPGMVRLAAAAKPADGIALVTDAIAATGAGDGRYILGELDVDVSDGVARLVEGGALAGSTLTMDAAFRNTVAAGLSLGAASRAASTNPARVIGVDDEVGAIAPGLRANLVVLDEALTVAAVIVDGDVVAGALDRA